ncbi:hypothetical protein [Gracilibacillus saliphilus]|uniref:hypothetical protein n=1 Tax=Gracilibacillus saliphilus TaxID=543890 RepID=UPI0013D5B2B1|nr:hypothetical protein [Gracilibacillus saliphilus]
MSSLGISNQSDIKIYVDDEEIGTAASIEMEPQVIEPSEGTPKSLKSRDLSFSCTGTTSDIGIMSQHMRQYFKTLKMNGKLYI